MDEEEAGVGGLYRLMQAEGGQLAEAFVRGSLSSLVFSRIDPPHEVCRLSFKMAICHFGSGLRCHGLRVAKGWPGIS
ncbi:hypothetical protein [Brevundimonas intermedia]|uniref:hypothetical protein n=1 Tax=Brevundimonas intermedia TaxID=74315 RepID=UPI001FD7605E|nr:hypothetical protein [Brevundimonas intermedia]